jgi:hypothetical protein
LSCRVWIVNHVIIKTEANILVSWIHYNLKKCRTLTKHVNYEWTYLNWRGITNQYYKNRVPDFDLEFVHINNYYILFYLCGLFFGCVWLLIGITEFQCFEFQKCDFRIKTMFGSSLPPVICRRAHVLFTLFVFVYA